MEEVDITETIPDKEIKIAIAVGIREGWAGDQNTGDPEGVVGGSGEGGRGRSAGVLEIEVGVSPADEEIKITIAIGIHQGWTGECANIVDPEGVGRGCAVGGSGSASRSDVPEKEGVAVGIADKEIQITIAIDIRKGRGGFDPNIGDPEGIGGWGGVGGSGSAARVLEKDGVAVVIADEEIKIAIGVGIREGRLGREDHGSSSDPVGIDAGSGVGGCGGAAGVPENVGVAVILTNEEIEIAIGIDIRKSRGGAVANIADPEGIGDVGSVGRSGGEGTQAAGGCRCIDHQIRIGAEGASGTRSGEGENGVVAGYIADSAAIELQGCAGELIEISGGMAGLNGVLEDEGIAA